MKIKESNKAGIVWIGFKENAKDEIINERISKFYKENEDIIAGMTFDKVEDVGSMKKAKHRAESFLMYNV